MSQTQSSHRAGAIEYILAMFLSGTIGMMVFESRYPALGVVFYRCLFGSIPLFVHCIWKGYFRAFITDRRALGLAALSGVCLVSNWGFLFRSYATVNISVATLAYHIYPFIVLILGRLFLGEPLQFYKVLMLVLAFVGLVLIVDIDVTAATFDTAYLLGIGCALAAASLFSTTIILVKRIGKGRIAPHAIAWVQVTMGLILLSPFLPTGPSEIRVEQWPFLIGLGIIHTYVMYAMMYDSFTKLSIVAIAILSFLYPLTTVVVDIVVYDRELSPTQYAGMCLIGLMSIAINLPWGQIQSLVRQRARRI